jgi:hypothetical protein
MSVTTMPFPAGEAPAPPEEDPVGAFEEAYDRYCEARSEMLRRAAVIDHQGLWKRHGATSMTGWLTGRFGWAWSTAREHVRVARALVALPAIRDASRRGRICWDQLRPLVRFADPESDAAWAERAPRMRPSTLYLEARRREEVRADQAESDHRLRFLSLQWDHDRAFLHLEGMLAREQGAAFESALGARAEKVAADPGAEDRRGARLVDTLVGAIAGRGDRPPEATLVVHADASVLEEAAGNAPAADPSEPSGSGLSRLPLAETETGVRLPAEAVRRLACEADLEWVVERDDRPIGIGRSRRKVPGWLRRQVAHRDRECRFPGCSGRSFLHVHHVRHWVDGGRTDLDNLVLLCSAHHRAVHEGGWRVVGDPQGEVSFTHPRRPPLRRWRAEGVRDEKPRGP